MEDENIETRESETQSCSNTNDSLDMTNLKESLAESCCENNSKYDDDSDDDEEYSDAKGSHSDDDEELDLDDEAISESHKDLSDEELQKLKHEASDLKTAGNECFKKAEYTEAVTLYTKALNICPLKFQNDRSVLYANRAAARIGQEKKDDAVLDCNKAIELNPTYLKAVLRRAQLHRKLENLERCLEDYQKVMELDRNNAEARQACATLPGEINEKNEKLKAEMFGKLKELGNMCLKPFGLSTDNFKVVQDPNSGGYSVNFQNNGS